MSFEILPIKIKASILDYLSIKELTATERVSKKFQKAVERCFEWRTKKYFPQKEKIQSLSWKAHYNSKSPLACFLKALSKNNIILSKEILIHDGIDFCSNFNLTKEKLFFEIKAFLSFDSKIGTYDFKTKQLTYCHNDYVFLQNNFSDDNPTTTFVKAGDLAVTGGEDGTIHLRDLSSETPFHTLKMDSQITSLHVTKSRIVATCSASINIWEIQDK